MFATILVFTYSFLSQRSLSRFRYHSKYIGDSVCVVVNMLLFSCVVVTFIFNLRLIIIGCFMLGVCFKLNEKIFT